MLCPLCSQRVPADAAACPRCGANFRAGHWRPLPERRHFPGPGRVALHAMAVVLLAAVVSIAFALVAHPPQAAEGGRLTGAWLFRTAGHLLATAMPVFLSLSGVGLAAVVMVAMRRGLRS